MGKHTPLYTFGKVNFDVMRHEVIRQLTKDTLEHTFSSNSLQTML